MKVGVIGSGFMGGGIAQVCAQAGHSVVCYDTSKEALDRCTANIVKSFDKRIAKGKATEEDKQKVVANIQYTETMDAMADREVIIEAVFENYDVKVGLFQKLNDYTSKECIYVSNTSGLSITDMGEASGRPALFMGAHFFSPVPVMKLVEAIRGAKTSDATFKTVWGLLESLNKVLVNAPDSPGFIVNVLLVYVMPEAGRVLELGASKEDIDKVLKVGMGMPMGALALADMTGLDISLNSCFNMWKGLNGEFAAPRELQRLVDLGHFGQKTGRGYYSYEK